jgi:hypothetical protein
MPNGSAYDPKPSRRAGHWNFSDHLPAAECTNYCTNCGYLVGPILLYRREGVSLRRTHGVRRTTSLPACMTALTRSGGKDKRVGTLDNSRARAGPRSSNERRSTVTSTSVQRQLGRRSAIFAISERSVRQRSAIASFLHCFNNCPKRSKLVRADELMPVSIAATAKSIPLEPPAVCVQVAVCS